MSDIIKLLPDSIANQIAAGEVISRPANVVKELLENAIDAKAKRVEVYIMDAGKKLIQVVDDGIGMSESDARMSLERHSTSKLADINDLYKIKTMGFRGEALASIVSVAQVELKTISKQANNNIGTIIEVENSQVIRQESIPFERGTSISVKNLFFNVPARRHFLKSDTVEIRHILEEFTRIAIANPNVTFSIKHNKTLLYHFVGANIMKRIHQIFSKKNADNIMFHTEKMDDTEITCYLGKPIIARKSKAAQYFFVNNRFVRSPYFHHAVYSTYKNYLPLDKQPFYIIFLEINPEKLDINIHPTKQEIKINEEKVFYQFITSIVRYMLAKYSITSSIDFETSKEVNNIIHKLPTEKSEKELPPENSDHAIANDFKKKNQTYAIDNDSSNRNLSAKIFYESLNPVSEPEQKILELGNERRDYISQKYKYILVYEKYAICQINDQCLCMFLNHVYQEYLYNKYTEYLNTKHPSQKVIFPEKIDFSPSEKIVFEATKHIFAEYGYELNPFGANSYLIQSIPIDPFTKLPTQNPQHEITHILHGLSEFDEHTIKGSKKDLIKPVVLSKSILKKNWLEEDINQLIIFLVNQKLKKRNFLNKLTYKILSKDDFDV